MQTKDSPSFTRLTVGSTGINQGILDLQDFTKFGTTTVAQIKGLLDGTNGGQIQMLTKVNGGSLTERFSISQNGGVSIKTDFVGLQINSADGVTEQGYIYNSGFGTKDFVIDAAVGSSTKGILFRTGSGFDRMRISDTGNVGIGTNTPSEKLDVDGVITHRGVSLNETTVRTSTTQITSHDIDKVIVVVGSVNFSRGWVTFLSYNNFAVGGSYIIHIYSNDSSDAPAHYYYNYTGVMSWTSFPNTNDFNSSQEIPLHGYGRAVEGVGPSIKLRTLSRNGNLTPELQIADATGVNADALFNFTFKMRRML